MQKLPLVAMGSIALLTIAGCASTAPSQDAEPVATPSVTNESPEPQAEDTSAPEESDSAAEMAESMANEEIILAALMGPDGEYAAAASYLAVLEEYGQVEPYATIYEAELRHADALIRQLERLGVEVPENPYLGEIPAPEDLQSAAEAWAEGEVLNIELYDYLLTMTDDEQLTKVLNNLRSASLDSHLPAFRAAAEMVGLLMTQVGSAASFSQPLAGAYPLCGGACSPGFLNH